MNNGQAYPAQTLQNFDLAEPISDKDTPAAVTDIIPDTLHRFPELPVELQCKIVGGLNSLMNSTFLTQAVGTQLAAISYH